VTFFSKNVDLGLKTIDSLLDHIAPFLENIGRRDRQIAPVIGSELATGSAPFWRDHNPHRNPR
jgi:hypothetical protein